MFTTESNGFIASDQIAANGEKEGRKEIDEIGWSHSLSLILYNGLGWIFCPKDVWFD